MKLQTESLLAALEVLKRVPLRSGIECSEYVKMSAKGGHLRLFLSSDIVGEVSVTMTDAEEFDFFIERSLFLPFIENAEGKEITFKVEPDSLTLIDKRRRAKYKALGKVIGGYVNIQKKLKDEKQIAIDPTLLKRLQLAAEFATFDSMSPQLNCVFFSKTGLMSSNTYSIFSSEDTLPFQGPFPLELVPLLGKNTTVYVHKTGARLEFPGGWVFCAIRDRCRTAFPEAKIATAVAEGKKVPIAFQTTAKIFSGAIEKLNTYVRAVANIDVSLKLEGKAGESEITLVCAERQATFRERMKIVAPLASDLSEEMMMHEVRNFLKEFTIDDVQVTVRCAPKSWHYITMAKHKLQVITSRKDK